MGEIINPDRERERETEDHRKKNSMVAYDRAVARDACMSRSRNSVEGE